MNTRLRDRARDFAPPVMRRMVQRWRKSGLRFGGRPTDWAAAQSMSGGYDSQQILERVIAACREVEAGRASYERDSVLFHEPDYPFPLLSVVLGVAARRAGQVSVLDFGGSLGSIHRQCRPMLAGLSRVRWCVVEQPHFVAAGRAEFSTDQLHFEESVREACANGGFDVVLAASVLQYLEDPEGAIRSFDETGAEWLVIDRTPLCDEPVDQLCIQHVPESIYTASYPCRLFSRDRLLARLRQHWQLVCEFPGLGDDWQTEEGVRFGFRGLILQRIPT